MVLQACDGMCAPSAIPDGINKDSVMPGRSKIIKRDGTQVRDNVQFRSGSMNPLGDRIVVGNLLLSQMRVDPLDQAALMPPEGLLDEIIKHIVNNQWPGLNP